MEFIVLLIIVIIIYFILKVIFDVNIRKLKEFGEDKQLDELTENYPKNIDICKYYLKILKNEDVKIEEDEKSNSTLYLVMGNKIFLGNLKNSYTRIQTIAHECLHSIQSKKMLWFNFIFSNLYLLYFVLICILSIFNVIKYKMLYYSILILLGLVFYSVRVYLENDAMIKARFLAKKYMEEVNISSKKDIDIILNKYDELNNIGIKITNFQLLSNVFIKLFILAIIFIIF